MGTVPRKGISTTRSDRGNDASDRDQGVDLIVEKGPLRYAIQAKGYHNSVSNNAVQEAVAGMAHYRCNACAVITNSRFTAGAEELALSNRCKLVGEEQIPALVLGKLVV